MLSRKRKLCSSGECNSEDLLNILPKELLNEILTYVTPKERFLLVIICKKIKNFLFSIPLDLSFYIGYIDKLKPFLENNPVSIGKILFKFESPILIETNLKFLFKFLPNITDLELLI